MELGSTQVFKKLTAEEKARRFREGLCTYCGERGHIVAKCPTKPATPPNQFGQLKHRVNSTQETGSTKDKESGNGKGSHKQ